MTTEDTIQNESSSRCRKCHRNLRNPDSMKHGYGKTCYKKIINGNFKLAKKSELAGLATITDPDLASRTMNAILRLVHAIEIGNPVRRFDCPICKTTLHNMPLESFDIPHNSSEKDKPIMPGFGKPQWFYLHDRHNDTAIWKIGIREPEILAEMKSHGDIPPNWGGEP